MVALLDEADSSLAQLPVHDLECVPTVDAVLASGPPDIVIIGPGVPDPVRTSQQVRHLNVPVLICAPPDRLDRIRQSFHFAQQTPVDLTFLDLTDEEKLAGEVLRALDRSRKRRRNTADSLLELAPVGILKADLRGRILSWNSHAAREFAQPLEPGLSVGDLFDAPPGPSVLHPSGPSAVHRVTSGAGRRHFDVRSAPFVSPSGEPGTTFVVVDVTDRVLAEQENQHNRALLDVLFESTPVGLGYWDRDLRFQRVNQALAEMNGVPAQEHAGRYLMDVLPNIDAGVESAMRQVIDSGQPLLQHEASGYTPAQPGVLRTWSLAYYPVRLGDRIAGVAAVCEDVTDRKQVHAEIARALERERLAREEAEMAETRAAFLARAATELASSLDYRATLAAVARLAVPDVADWASVDMLAPDGTLQRLAVAHTDPEKAELARTLHDRYPPGSDHPLRRVIETGQPEIARDMPASFLEMHAADAEHLAALQALNPRSYIVVPIRTSANHVLGAITLISGESGRRFSWADLRLADELADRAAMAIQNAQLYETAEERRKAAEEVADQLRRANKEVEQFAFVTSHDLQEPLRTVASFAQLLERRHGPSLTPEAREYIGHVVEGARRMSHLIHDLLEYSQITRGHEPRLQTVEMEQTISQCLESLRTTIADTGATVTHDEMPVLRRMNPSQLHQLLTNLLSNALKFARPGVPPQIHISAAQEGEWWHFRVRDNGQGFNASYGERIFELFKRLHGRDIPGTGIGLALCRRIVERHGGRISAESQPGEGSVFHFTLPD